MQKINFNTILNILLIIIVGIYIGRYFYMLPGFHNGDLAPDFTATTLTGDNMQLSKMKGNYILLDFWASWCGPCRQENPALAKLYNQYHGAKYRNGEDFEIVSVAIERNDVNWKRAIQRDQLNWPNHIVDISSNMKFFNSDIALKYKIKQIPTKYLLNPEGKIIGVNMSVEQIEQVLRNALQEGSKL